MEFFHQSNFVVSSKHSLWHDHILLNISSHYKVAFPNPFSFELFIIKSVKVALQCFHYKLWLGVRCLVIDVNYLLHNDGNKNSRLFVCYHFYRLQNVICMKQPWCSIVKNPRCVMVFCFSVRPFHCPTTQNI